MHAITPANRGRSQYQWPRRALTRRVRAYRRHAYRAMATTMLSVAMSVSGCNPAVETVPTGQTRPGDVVPPPDTVAGARAEFVRSVTALPEVPDDCLIADIGDIVAALTEYGVAVDENIDWTGRGVSQDYGPGDATASCSTDLEGKGQQPDLSVSAQTGVTEAGFDEIIGNTMIYSNVTKAPDLGERIWRTEQALWHDDDPRSSSAAYFDPDEGLLIKVSAPEHVSAEAVAAVIASVNRFLYLQAAR